MKIVAALFADFMESFLGGPSRLSTAVGGSTYIGHTLARLTHIEGVAGRVLVVRPRDAAIALDCLKQSGLEDRVTISTCDSGERPRRGLLRSARKWGLASWRGTPLGTTWFDEFIEPLAVARLLDETGAEGALCFDGCQPLLDPEIASRMVQHVRDNEADANFVFTQAPPGLAGILLRRQVTRELLENNWPAGLLLSYRPELPRGDLITRAMCCPVSPAVAQTQARFCGDTRTSSEVVVGVYETLGERANADSACEFARQKNQQLPVLPVELELELTTADPLPRTTPRPRGERVPQRSLSDFAALDRLLAEFAGAEPVRQMPELFEHAESRAPVTGDGDSLLVLGGHGDPLQHARFADVLRSARRAGVCGISVVSPLVDLSEANLEALFENRVDVLEIQIDATSRESYLRLHGVDAYERVLANIERIEAERRRRVCPQPLLVPSLTRCAATLPELESFFDSWTRRTGWAVIRGYSTFSERLPADELIGCGPLVRAGCRRLNARLMLHADGAVPRCGQDFEGAWPLGYWTTTRLCEIWGGSRLVTLREQHEGGRFSELPLCRNCDEWFRP